MREPSNAENARRELWADRENQQRQTEYRQAYAAWVHEDQVYGWMLQAARTGVGFAPEQVGIDFVPKRGETLFGLFNGCTLLEVKRAPGTVRAAFSNLIGLGADLKAGSVSAIIERSADEPTLTGEGEVVVTSRRVVLKGRHRVSDWKYRHLVAVQHDPARPISYLDTGHRHHVTGIGYPANQSALFRFALDLGVDLATGANMAPLIAAVESHRAEHSRRPPAPPSVATPEGAPAGGRKVLGLLAALLTGRPGQSGGRRILHGTLASTALVVLIAGASALAAPPSHLSAMESHASMQAAMPSTVPAPSNVTSPSVTPSPGPASTPSLTATPTPTPTSSPTVTPTVTPSSTPTLTTTPTPTTSTVPGDEPVDKFSAGPKPKPPKLLRTDAASVRVGAVCRDGSTSGATGRGACSWHNGVARWLYEKPYWVQEHKATNAKRQKAYKVALKEWTAATTKNQLMARYPCSKGPYKEGSAGYTTWRDSNGDGIACQPL